MFAVRRLFAVGSVLTLIGLLASTHLWGQAGKRSSLLDSTQAKRPSEVDSSAAAEMSLSRFADQPLVLYHRPDQKETLLAVQVKPPLKAVPVRPRDYLVLIDTAAHMAGGDLQTAQTLLNSLLRQVGKEDRIALWTVNTKQHDLTNGFQNSQNLSAALKKLSDEFPAGAVNLRDSLPEAIKLFDGKQDRQHVILFLGSGQSIAGPVDAELRALLCKDMIANHIAFFSVPLGGYLDPYNLHGFANFTGGKVVRYGLGSKPETWVANLFQALSQPILYDCEIQLPAKVAEVLPAKLPPLRPDVPTLVVGKFAGAPAKDEARFDYTITGKVNGEETRVTVSEKVPAPDDDNYFLANMLDQWKTQKDRPALLQADRALDFAFENNQLARADLVAQAEWALEKKQVDAAARLYQQALQADPTSARAKAGVKLVAELRAGKKTWDDIKDYFKFKKGETFTRFQQGKRVVLPAEQLFANQDDKKDNAPPPPIAPDVADQNRINEIRGRQAIVDKEQTEVVNDAIRQANRMVLTRPDDAHDFLKRTLDSVSTNPDISNDIRASLSNRLARGIQNVDITGAVVKRDQEEALRLMANANARTTLVAQERMEQDVIRARMRVYHNLMDQAREQAAYRQAQSIRKDLIDQGLMVPEAVTAGYAVGLAGYHLREVQELRRIREERWLATLLEVERSHIPFPDEPPVEFPPAATWRALSEMRKGRYESATFGADLPERGIRLRQQLQQEIDYGGLEDARATLSDALDQLSKRYNLTFDINDKAFEMDQLKDVARTPVADPTPIPPMRTTLSTVLRKILRRVPAPSGTTFLIRRDVIEITTGTFAAAEKTVRVYPVADIVTPLPNAVNPLQLMGAATIFGLSAGALGGFAGVGGLGGIGLGGGIRGGALGLQGLGGVAGMVGMAGMGGLGGLGGVGGIAGLGGQGFQNLGAAGNAGQGGFQGQFQGQGNMGNGGLVGFGGQNLGQFGNLGGQFGLQGGDQSSILLTLIRQVVGRPRDWAVNFDPITGQPVNPLDDQANAPEGLNQENNQLGYYPPALALVVKGSSTIHTRATNLIINPNAAVAAIQKRDPKIQVAGNAEERPDLDPRKVWQDALAKGINNPGLIIATADFLVLANKFDHAVEFLKANLRQGIVVEPWVFKALAIALRMSGGSTEDIERAEVSTADMEPKNAGGYLEAAKAMAHDEKYGLALAFCRQAALLEPGIPYAYEEALSYAELARDPKAMQWAADNLLSRDWPVENKQLHDRALQKIDALVKVLNQHGRKDEADKLTAALANKGKRDLVIKLNWQGEADLDLHVTEPTGSTCSPLHRQSIGGGVLIGDSLADMTSETYLAAEGFTGEYEIEIEKIWGHPLNNKVQLKIIRHQGTPEESEQLRTVELKSKHSERIKIKLDEGRRTETAYVPPPSAQKKPDTAQAEQDSPDKVLHKLRVLADPEVTGVSRSTNGGFVSQGQPVLPSAIKSGRRETSATADNDRTLYQTRVKPFVQNAMDVTASAVLSADRRYLRLSMTPVFNTVTPARNAPVVVNPTIPGAR